MTGRAMGTSHARFEELVLIGGAIRHNSRTR